MKRFFYIFIPLVSILFFTSSALRCEEENPFLNLFGPLISSISNQIDNMDDDDENDTAPMQKPTLQQPIQTLQPAMPIAPTPQPVIQAPVVRPQPPQMFVRSSTLPELRGAIKHPKSADPMPRFRVLFQGRETMSNPEGFFTFPTDASCSKYSILICTQVVQTFDKNNTVRFIRVPENQPYRYFVFQKNIWEERWEQQEKKLPAASRKIPKHSVVVFINPEFFDHFETWNIAMPSNITKLPFLVLKASATPATLQTASADSILKSLDATIFHQSIKQVVTAKPTSNSHKISLAVVRE